MRGGVIGPEDACLPNFHPINRDQMFLLPISIKDWLPGDELAWFVLDAVGQMDLAQFYARYRVDGKGAYSGASRSPIPTEADHSFRREADHFLALGRNW